MTIHRKKRFYGGRKAGPAPHGAFKGRDPPQARSVPLQARNKFSQTRIVPQKK